MKKWIVPEKMVPNSHNNNNDGKFGRRRRKGRQQGRTEVRPNRSDEIVVNGREEQGGRGQGGTAGREANPPEEMEGRGSEESDGKEEEEAEEEEEEGQLSIRRPRRSIRPEDVLWWVCMLLTFRCFDLPYVLIFHRKIDRRFLKMALLCPPFLVLLLLTYSLARLLFRDPSSLRFLSQLFQFLSICCFFCTAIFFCLSTWDLFGIWSLFISMVTAMSLLAAIAVL